MRVEQRTWTSDGWTHDDGAADPEAFDVVLVFGDLTGAAAADALRRLADAYPGARTIGCTTAGEIAGTVVTEGTLVATAFAFDRGRTAIATRTLDSAADSRHAGRVLAEELHAPDLRHVFVLSEGLAVNGSELARGLAEGAPEGVSVSGGLAADGDRFGRTSLLLDGAIRSGHLVALGLYGESLEVACGSMGGWDAFGPDRIVTRSRGNVVYQLDDEPALELYHRYLGSYAADLPASGLHFPLAVRTGANASWIVRTLLGVDEAEGSITFAGDVQQFARARLMKANVDRLVDGASEAAAGTRTAMAAVPDLAILISCVGRRLVMKGRVEEEVEAVSDVLGAPVQTGFYSYGEICPSAARKACDLHNQTMTVTTVAERA